MGTQATIRFDIEASTAKLSPQLAAGEARLRQFGQNARAAVRGGAGAGGAGGGAGAGGAGGGMLGGLFGGGGAMAGDWGLRSGLGTMAGMIGGGAGQLLGAGTMVAAAPIAAAAGAFALSQTIATEARSIHQQSQALGVSVEAYQEYGRAAERAGVETGTFTAAIERLRNKAAEAINGDQGARGLFRSLGVDVQKLDTMGTQEILEQTAQGIDRLGGSSRARAEITAFGRAGAQLDPVLRKLSKGVEATVLSFRDVKNLETEKTFFGELWTGIEQTWSEGHQMIAEIGRGIYSTFSGQGFWAPSISYNAEVAKQEAAEKANLAKHNWQEAGAQRAPALMNAREKLDQEMGILQKIHDNQGFDPSNAARNDQLWMRAMDAASQTFQQARAAYQTPAERLRGALSIINGHYHSGQLEPVQAARAAVLAEEEAAASQMPAGQAGAYDIDSAEGYSAVMGLRNQAQFRQAAHQGLWPMLQGLLPQGVLDLIPANRNFQKQPIAFDGRQ